MSNKRSTYRPTTYQRIMRRVTIGAVCVSVVAGAACGGAVVQRAADSAPRPNTAYGNVLHILPCMEEDSRNCVWDAGHRGNDEGDSFIDYNGTVYYMDKSE